MFHEALLRQDVYIPSEMVVHRFSKGRWPTKGDKLDPKSRSGEHPIPVGG